MYPFLWLSDERLSYVRDVMPLRCDFAPADVVSCKLCGAELHRNDWIFYGGFGHDRDIIICYHCGCSLLLHRGVIHPVDADWPSPWNSTTYAGKEPS